MQRITFALLDNLVEVFFVLFKELIFSAENTTKALDFFVSSRNEHNNDSPGCTIITVSKQNNRCVRDWSNIGD